MSELKHCPLCAKGLLVPCSFSICQSCKGETANHENTSFNKQIKLLGDKYEAAFLGQKKQIEKLKHQVNKLQQKIACITSSNSN